MKTMLSRAVAFCALLCFFLAPVMESDAQVVMPYRVRNAFRCPVKIEYRVYEKDPAGTGCTILCFTNTFLVPANATVPLPVWPNYPICGCGIEICVLDIAGVPVVPPICAGWPNPPFVSPASGPNPTGAQCINPPVPLPPYMINVNVGPGVATITP